MAINIKCDTDEEAFYITDAINSAQAEMGPVPHLNPKNTSVYIGDTKYEDWGMSEDGEIPWDFYGLEPEFDDDEEDDD